MTSIKVGDRVQYSTDWLRSTCTYTGDIPFARGTVIDVDPRFGGGLATVDWSRPDTHRVRGGSVPRRILCANLEKVR